MPGFCCHVTTDNISTFIEFVLSGFPTRLQIILNSIELCRRILVNLFCVNVYCIGSKSYLIILQILLCIISVANELDNYTVRLDCVV